MNDLLQNKISQKTAKVNLLEMYFENGRCKLHELEAAKRDLADLEREIEREIGPANGPAFDYAQAPKGGTVTEYGPLAPKGGMVTENGNQTIVSPKNKPIQASTPPLGEGGPIVLSYEPETPQASDLLAVKHQLVMASRELRKKQADLGNTMAMMDKEVVAVDICEEQINLAHKIEKIWDQYRYIERHGHLPTPDDAYQPQELTPAQETKLLKTKEDLRKLYDKRSKLKAKLKNPSAHAKTFATMKTKPAEWEAELAFAEQEIKALELVRMELIGE